MSTLVLELETDMVELDAALFITTETTIAAGELATGSIAVQVGRFLFYTDFFKITASSIVLVADDQQLATVAIDSSVPIAATSIVDPFILLLAQNGQFLLYRLITSPNIYLKPVPILEKLKHESSPVTSACIYKDISGLIQFCSATGNDEIIQVGPIGRRSTTNASDGFSRLKKEEAMEEGHEETDDIDLFLYGDDEKKEPKKAQAKEKQTKKKIIRVDQEFDDWAPKLDTDVQDPNHILPTYWMLLTRENGNLYIYSVPEIQLVYMVRKFNSLPEILKDDMSSAYEDAERNENQLVSIAPSVQDTQIISVDSIMVKPEDVCCYRACVI